MTTRPGYVWDATASEWVEIGQAAVVSPFKYQTSQPSSPATGDIWIDSDDDVPSVDSTLYYRWTKTMSGGETSLSGTDNNSLALKYTPGYESVFINGVLQVRGSDYTASTGTTVTGLTALTASDVVMVESIIAYSVGDTYTQSTLDGKFSPITTTGLVLVTSATVGTAVTTVNIPNCFNSTYDTYRIVYSGGVGSTTTDLYVKLDGITTGYYSSLIYKTFNSTTVIGANQSNIAYWIWFGSATTNGAHLLLDIQGPNLAKKKTATGHFLEPGTTTGNGVVNGWLDSTTQATGLTITVQTGTITGGTIKVYGYK
jgi:hypothetical protein